MTERKPAQVWPPGEFIREELRARRWTHKQLARMIGLTSEEVGLLILGKYPVTEELAHRLGVLFKQTSAQYWMNLEKGWREEVRRHGKG